MKYFRSLGIPVVCFIAAWGIAFLTTTSRQTPPEEELSVTRQHFPNRPKRDSDETRKLAVTEWVEEFQTRPTGEWSKMWEDFASTATVKDLESITPKRLIKRSGERVRRDARNVPYLLATEELAVRTNRTPAREPGAYAALAETDPEAALRNLEKNNFGRLSIGVMRTLARKDPAGTWARLQAMRAPMPDNHGSDEGGMKSGSPAGAILYAWARQDPGAAVSAVMKLTRLKRLDVAGGVAETWASHDAPAAIRFIMGFLEHDAENSYDMRLESILRIGFMRQPSETAELMAKNEVLRGKIGSWDFRRVLRLWHFADPQATLAWVIEEKNIRQAGDPVEETTRGNYRGQVLFDSIKDDPVAVERFIRRLSAIDSDSAGACLQTWSRRNPEESEALAAELGMVFAENQRSRSASIDDDPAGACDIWLEKLERHQDPELAMAALGWDQSSILRLAIRAARFFPEKAEALARLVPASSLGAILPSNVSSGERAVRNLRRYWPDLEVLPPPPRSPTTLGSTISQDELELDPAAAAERLLSKPFPASDVVTAVEGWAPYDPVACEAWLARMPEGDARKAGELKLRHIQDGYQPPEITNLLQETARKEAKVVELLHSGRR